MITLFGIPFSPLENSLLSVAIASHYNSVLFILPDTPLYCVIHIQRQHWMRTLPDTSTDNLAALQIAHPIVYKQCSVCL